MCHLCEKGKEGLGDQLTIAAIRSPDEGVETYPIGMAVLPAAKARGCRAVWQCRIAH